MASDAVHGARNGTMRLLRLGDPMTDHGIEIAVRTPTHLPPRLRRVWPWANLW